MKMTYTAIIALGCLSLTFVVLAEVLKRYSEKWLGLRTCAVICSILGYAVLLLSALAVGPSQVPGWTLMGYLTPVILALTVFVIKNPRLG